MTNDEAGNRVMSFLANTLLAFVDVAVKRDGEDVPKTMDWASAFIASMISELTSGEMGQAMEMLIEDKKSLPKGSREGIRAWCQAIIDDAGGLKSFHKYELGGSRATMYDSAQWVIRCLANPKCVGAGETIQAILNERARKLGLPDDDLEMNLAAGLLDDKLSYDPLKPVKP